MRLFIATLRKGSSMELWGGQISRCVKCDDDLTILEVVYEQDNNSGIPFKK